MSDAQTMRYARNWAKHLMKKAARPKRTVSAETLANLARGRRIRAENLAKMKGAGKSGGYIPEAVKKYGTQARRHARALAYKSLGALHEQAPPSSRGAQALRTMGEHLETVNASDYAREFPFFARHYPGMVPPAFNAPPKYLYPALGAAALTAGLGYGVHKARKMRKSMDLNEEVRARKMRKSMDMLNEEVRRLRALKKEEKKGEGKSYA